MFWLKFQCIDWSVHEATFVKNAYKCKALLRIYNIWFTQHIIQKSDTVFWISRAVGPIISGLPLALDPGMQMFILTSKLHRLSSYVMWQVCDVDGLEGR